MKPKIEIVGTDAVITDEFGTNTFAVNLTHAARIKDAAGDDKEIVARVNEILAAGDTFTDEQLETDEMFDKAIADIEARRKTAHATRAASARKPEKNSEKPLGATDVPTKPKAAKKKAKK